MIETPRFIIPHIPKTGGDAIKLIVARLGLPDLKLIGVEKPEKHNPKNPDGRDLVLPIRQLPRRELSWLKHNQIYMNRYGGFGAEFILQELNGERCINSHLRFGVWPRFYIRSEFLRRDLVRVLKHYYPELTRRELRVIREAPTKPTMRYNRNLGDHFTFAQMRTLYAESPNWSKCEREAYGGLLTDIKME